ncbi:MAG: hypothetical protein NTU51_04400 [Bacteroidetes bacterium]|nr:hypothetical protein [Bacteroidota bacterium]
MKKILVFLSAIALISMVGCKKDSSSSEPTGLNNQDIVSAIFQAGMAWNTPTKSLNSIYPINITVESTIAGPEGGNIHVLGSVTGSMTVNDQTGAIISGTMLLGLTETINAYAFKSNGQTYTMNGAPYISLAGTFTLVNGGTFGTASSMDIGGGVRVTGPGVDKTININLTIILNSHGTGGSVSGTIDGVSVNYKL